MARDSIYLEKLHKKYRVIYLHNPKHFYLNSLWIEDLPNGDKLLCAHPRLTRNNRKNFQRLALLKQKKIKVELFSDESKAVNTNKPFNGIFQD